MITATISRRWVARIFTVWRTHFRTFIIVSHALAHRTSIFDNRTFFYYIEKSRAVDQSTIQFLIILWVLLTRRANIASIKGFINSFQYL